MKRELPPEDHLKANTVLSSLTIIVSFLLSILLFAIVPDKHPLIFVTAGLLIAIGGWHIQTLIRTLKLKRQWKRRTPLTEVQAGSPETEPVFRSASTARLLDQADFTNAVPASVTENTTRHLVDRPDEQRKLMNQPIEELGRLTTSELEMELGDGQSR